MNLHGLVDDVPTPSSAFLTDDPLEILRYAYQATMAHMPVALVTLVEIRGGTARALGANMAVRGDGRYCGFVSGGCTEAAVAAEALDALRAGHDRYLMLGDGSPFFDIVLPCGGGISLSIHLLHQMDVIRRLISNIEARRCASLSYDPARQSIECLDAFGATGWSNGVFVTSYEPQPRILLCGRSIELRTTIDVARAAGYEVDINNDGEVPRHIDENCAIALLYHDLDRELPMLRAALDARPFYIGALGSRRTHEKRSAALRALGYGEDDIARIKAPIGIFDKARDASAIALSVVADIAFAKVRIRSARA